MNLNRLSWPIFVCLAGCAPLSQQQRAAKATLDCARAVLRTDVPETTSDQVKHCLAGGFIARRCSVGEAYLAGIAKELKDAVGPGNPQWRDWQADRAGVRCARASNSDEDLRTCCGFTSAPAANR